MLEKSQCGTMAGDDGRLQALFISHSLVCFCADSAWSHWKGGPFEQI